MSVKTFVKQIADMPVRKRFYLIPLHFSEKAVEQLQIFIQDGVIIPDPDEIRARVNPEYQDKFMQGEMILPAGYFIKVKDFNYIESEER